MIYVWDVARQQYRDSAGRLVPLATIRQAVYDLSHDGQARMQTLMQQHLQGDSDRATWEREMRLAIKTYHVAAAVTARGGWAAMSPSDWGYTGRLVQTQYQFLSGFKADLDAADHGFTGATPEALTVRAGMYAAAVRGSFGQMQRRGAQQGDATEERRTRHGDHSCPDCTAAAELGWQPLGTLPAIGDSACLVSCHCWFTFRKGETEFGLADHGS